MHTTRWLERTDAQENRFSSRARDTPQHRKFRIVDSRASTDGPLLTMDVDQRFVFGGEACARARRGTPVHCSNVRGPASTDVTMRLLSTQLSANCARAHAALLRMRLELSAPWRGTLRGTRSPSCACPCARRALSCGGRLARRVLAGEHAARERAVRHHAQAVVRAGRQDLGFRHAVHRVVIRLAHDRRAARPACRTARRSARCASAR